MSSSTWINYAETSIAKKMSLTCSYIDDIITLNSDGYFDERRDDIYPNSLKLNKENDGNTEAKFLDLDISVQDKCFIQNSMVNMRPFLLLLLIKQIYLEIFLRSLHMEYSFHSSLDIQLLV